VRATHYFFETKLIHDKHDQIYLENNTQQEGQHPLTGQCAANFRLDLGPT